MTNTDADDRTRSRVIGGSTGVELATPVLDPAFYLGDPYPLYAKLREQSPLAHVSDPGVWVASRHADVVTISRDPATFSSARGVLTMEIGATYESPPTMMHTDPPMHTRYRELVQPGFRPSFIRSMEDGVRTRTLALVDRIRPGIPTDIVSELAVPLPLQVISDLLGVPEGEWPRFFRWSEAVIPGATDWPEEERAALSAEMVGYLVAAAADRRAHPADDIISELAAADLDGDSLSDAELAMFLVQLLVAGNETTRNMMSGGLLGFCDAPGQWKLLCDRYRSAAPRALPIAVEEMLRWTTPVVSFMRTTTRPVELAGEHLPGGAPILMLYASANRDENVFGPTASTFDIARDPNPHVAFGFGPHFCIGAVLARLEGRILLEVLADRFASIERAGKVERSASPVIAGIRSATVVFGDR